MRLPNGARATVDKNKVREYLLSSSHPVGRFKAKFFARLGFDVENWRAFVVRVQRIAVEGNAVVLEDTEFGRKYLVLGVLRGLNGTTAELDSIWIIRTGDDTPRLVTVYPREP